MARIHTKSTYTMTYLFRFLLPLLFLLWFFLFAIAKSSSTTENEKIKSKGSKLRGSNNDITIISSKNDNRNIQEKYKDTRNIKIEPFNHAIIVAGHAVMRLNKLSVADTQDSAWYLLSYQQDQGFPGIITSHIQAGITVAKSDSRSLLLFSGGQTRKDVGPTSEAASYYYLAQEKKWINPIVSRVFLEEFARDSYENLLFSLCRFREIVGKYPEKVTVVGFGFKKKRFTNLHRRAVAFPESNFTYIGLRPAHKNFDHNKAQDGEKAAVNGFAQDMYACSTPSLAKKRKSRNPFSRTIPYPLACPEMKELLNWCGPELFDETKVPWHRNVTLNFA